MSLARSTDVSSVLVGKTAGQLGVWLRQELTQRGYDLQYGGQSQFARDAGIHVSIVNRVINKDQGVEIDVLRRMGKPLGYSLGEMLVFSGQAERSELPVRTPEELEEALAAESDPNNPYTDPQERQIWAIDGLGDKVKGVLIRLVRSYRAEEADERPSAEVRQLRRPS